MTDAKLSAPEYRICVGRNFPLAALRVIGPSTRC